MNVTTLGNDIQQILLRCLEESRGKEICGFLLRSDNGQREFHLMKNFSSGYFNFAISDYDYTRIQYHAMKNRLQIEALIHSHASSLELSEGDVDCLIKSDFPWIVLTLEGSRLRHKIYYKSDYVR